MNPLEYHERLNVLSQTCLINSRYYRATLKRYTYRDRGVRIAVGVLGIVGLVTAWPDVVSAFWSVTIAVVALIAGVALNVFPLSDWANKHGGLYRLWNDLYRDVHMEEVKPCDTESDKSMSKDRIERLCDLLSKAESLHAEDPTSDRKLLLQCQGDQNEALWGAGIRTREQVEKHLKDTTRSASEAVYGAA